MSIKTFKVEQLKLRLDKFLAEQLPDLSRSKIQRDIEAGLVKVNNENKLEPKFVVRKDDSISYRPSKEEIPGPVNIPLKTLYNNHGLLILDKPAGLPVHPGAGFKGNSLAQGLLYHFKDIHLVGEEGRSGIVHRLDKDTSGVIAIALTSDMYDYLKTAWKEKKVKKEYIALVCGRLPNEHGLIDSPLGKSKKDFRKYTTDTQDMVLQKASLTEYQVLERLTYGDAKKGDFAKLDEYTLIKVKLHTGRTHQIRVHFSSLGFPLVGDTLYGGKKSLKLGFSRQALHAYSIFIPLPDGQSVKVESKLPNDIKELLVSLNSHKLNLL